MYPQIELYFISANHQYPVVGFLLQKIEVRDMVTQKDVHNQIVENATFSQKAYLAMQCQVHGVSVESVEQSMANIINGVVNAIGSETMRYLCKRMK